MSVREVEFRQRGAIRGDGPDGFVREVAATPEVEGRK